MKLKGGTSLWVGGGLVALALVVAVAAPLIALTDPVMDANLMNAEIPPGLDFPFGTDAQGRDIYSRILYGARISLTVGVVSQVLNSLIGVFLGCLALGVAENLTGAYVSPSFAEAITFIIIIAVLIVKPEGVFGRVRVRKA